MKTYLSLSVFTILFITSHNISGMEPSGSLDLRYKYQLPNQETITKRLCEDGFHDFSKKSHIGFLLSDTWINPTELSLTVDSFLTSYSENRLYIHNPYPQIHPHLAPTKPILIRMLFRNHPQVLYAMERDTSREKLLYVSWNHA
jgi:hypothetical protein